MSAGELGDALARLCAAVEQASSEQQVLQEGLEVVTEVLGAHVALDLRGTARGRTEAQGELRAPVVGGGTCFGELRASTVPIDDAVARAFSRAAAHIIGAGIALHRERADRSPYGADAREAAALTHQLRSPLATIGVAASTIRLRGDHLGADVRDQLLHDVEASVTTLRAAIDRLLGNPGLGGADGG